VRIAGPEAHLAIACCVALGPLVLACESAPPVDARAHVDLWMSIEGELGNADYGPAKWVASPNYYTSNRTPGSGKVKVVVVHTMQGSYAGSISWCKNPKAKVSAHYMVSKTGDITQMVKEKDIAWHVGSENGYTIGIEHEGFVSDPKWATPAMLEASSKLTCYLVKKWGLSPTKKSIKGHVELPNQTHTDPGNYWPWDTYLALVKKCADGEDPMANCNASTKNCDGKTSNGCETNLKASEANCGACGNNCGSKFAHVKAVACKGGSCTWTGCDAGWANCDGQNKDGCETHVAVDKKNCGSCGHSCGGQFPHVKSVSCQGGKCSWSGCDVGWGDCDGKPATGCETNLSNDVSDCGACGVDCKAVVNNASGPSCAGGACGYASCKEGFADCDGVPKNGCEASLASDVANCGACAKGCEGVFAHVSKAMCEGGACTWAGCAAGWGNCDGSFKTACETDLTATVEHCGTCGNSCVGLANTQGATCAAGACTWAGCDVGFADCDGDPKSGCETTPATDIANCGGCGNACAKAIAHATGLFCEGGKCGYTACEAGFEDCDANPSNGCETDIGSDAEHCGSCAHVCSPGLANVAAPACKASVCAYTTCLDGYGDCDGDPTNGCETNLSTDPAHCGACGKGCAGQFSHVALAFCGGGVCGWKGCQPGWGDCDGVEANGCELDVSTAPAHCGACGDSCYPTFPHADKVNCKASTCGYAACLEGWGDCDAESSNGCETSTMTNPSNCGGCGTACAEVVLNADGATCFSGKCGFASCHEGFADCDKDPGNGCEAELAADPINCGVCGKGCDALPNVHASYCRAGACDFMGCQPGWGDCDGLVETGCELLTGADVGHCGECERSCIDDAEHSVSPFCEAGRCRYGTCVTGFGDCDDDLTNGCEATLGVAGERIGGGTFVDLTTQPGLSLADATIIESLAKVDVVHGCADPQMYYCPGCSLTRRQLAAMVGQAGVLRFAWTATPPAQPTFPDVPEGDVAYVGVEILASKGIIAGCADGWFCPAVRVTRRDLARVLAAAVGLAVAPQSAAQMYADVPPEDADFAVIGAWKPSCLLPPCGATGNDGSVFCPDDPVTRAEATVAVAHAMELGVMGCANAPAGGVSDAGSSDALGSDALGAGDGGKALSVLDAPLPQESGGCGARHAPEGGGGLLVCCLVLVALAWMRRRAVAR